MTDNHAPARIVEKHEIAAPGQAVHPLVQAALMSKDIDIEKMRAMFAMQKEWEANEARKAYTSALAELTRDLPAFIDKDGKVSYGSGPSATFYKHATLANAMEQITEPLARHGFSLSWRPSTPDASKVVVTCRLTHAGGHHEEVTLSAPPDNKGAKGPAQAIASTITLLSRYSALAMLGIATKDMLEPTSEAAPADSVDPGLNLKAAGWLAKKNVPIPEAEKLVGRRVPEWTAGDLDKIRAQWGAKAAATVESQVVPPAAAPPPAEPKGGKTIADASAEPPEDYQTPGPVEEHE